MALKDWKLVRKRSEVNGVTGVYYNSKKEIRILVGNKVLSRDSNYSKEQYPFIVEESGSYNPIYHKYFDKKSDAVRFLKNYMKKN
jgi:hypothetical protein